MNKGNTTAERRKHAQNLGSVHERLRSNLSQSKLSLSDTMKIIHQAHGSKVRFILASLFPSDDDDDVAHSVVCDSW